MKFVTFEIAKLLKELGYNKYSNAFYTSDSKLHSSFCRDWQIETFLCFAPTYIEVWLWLWREKEIPISIMCDEHELLEKHWYPNSEKLGGSIGSFTDEIFYSDPEETIISTINYIFKNNLLCQQNNI